MMTKINTSLSPKEKAAVLLISLGDEYTAELRKHFTDDEFYEITSCFPAVQQISAEERASVVREFYEMCLTQKLISDGGVAYAMGILEKALGSERADSLIHTLSSFVQPHSFDFLVRDDAAQILEYTPTAFDISEEISMGGDVFSAGITSFPALSTQGLHFEDLDAYNKGQYGTAARTAPVFEDIAKLSERATVRVLREIAGTDLAVALKLASEDVSSAVFARLPKQLKDNIRAEMEVLGPVRVRDVEGAQQRIADVIARLEDNGEIVVARGIDAAYIA